MEDTVLFYYYVHRQRSIFFKSDYAVIFLLNYQIRVSDSTNKKETKCATCLSLLFLCWSFYMPALNVPILPVAAKVS